MMTMEWVEICRELLEGGARLAWIPIVCFVMLAGFIVFNLIVAVVVEAVATTEETVRQLDGIESNSPKAKLAEAQERADLLQSHLTEMMEQQEQIQFMLETMAGELLHLETERMKAKYRENRLKEEINRRIEYQKKIEEGSVEQKPANDAIKKISMQFLQKIEASKAERKQQEELQAEQQSVSDQESIHGSSTKKRKLKSWIAKPGMARDSSGKSLGTNESSNSAKSSPDQLDSPLGRSIQTRKRIDSQTRDTSRKGKEDSRRKESESTRTDDSEKKKKAINNWKKLIAINKDINL